MEEKEACLEEKEVCLEEQITVIPSSQPNYHHLMNISQNDPAQKPAQDLKDKDTGQPSQAKLMSGNIMQNKQVKLTPENGNLVE